MLCEHGLRFEIGKAVRRMSQRVQRYRDRAEVCERMAAQAKDHDAKASFDAVARQWRDLARQIEEMKFDQPPTKQTTTTALFKPNSP